MASFKQLMTLFSKSGIDEQSRREVIYRFTNGRTQSVRDLNLQELKGLCSKLSSRNFIKNVEPNTELLKKKKRSIVLKLATKVGIHNTENWENFNHFMLHSSILKKQLNAYQLDELDQLIRQFRAIEENFERSARKVGTKAHSHKYQLPHLYMN